jgi:type VI secretion system protein ImpL
MAAAPNQQARNDLFVFSRQLAGVRDPLINFLAEVLESDRYATPALVRGLYFTSVYQQGIPRNGFVQAAALSYGLPPRIGAAKAMQRSLTFFSKSLFHEAIYPEAGLAGDNMRVTRNKRRVFILASVVGALTAVFMTGGWQHYYRQNVAASEIVLSESKAFMDTKVSDRIDVTGRNLLEPLDHIRKAISVYGKYRDKLPLVADLGLYQGRIIGPKVEESYLNLLTTRYLTALGIGVIDQISAAEEGSNDKLAALRVYRMLEDKTNRRKEIVKNWMAKEWHTHFEGEGDTQRRLMAHLDYALDHVEADLPQFDSMVEYTQQGLRKTPLSQRVYQGIKQDARVELSNRVDLRRRIGPSFDLIYKNEEETAHDGEFIIDALFTTPGFKGYFIDRNDNIIDLAMIDQWVLGERDKIAYSDEDKVQLAERIRSHYINDYLDTWKRTLGRLEINEFDDIEYAVKVLETLTGPSAPVQRLIETVKQHGEIYPPLDVKDEQARIEAEKKLLSDPNRREAKRIQRNFHSLISLLEKGDKEAPYYEELIKALSATYDYMAGVQNAPDRGKAALTLARDRFKLDGADPLYALERIAAGLP